MHSQALDLACGCFLTFWADGDELRSGLSCCKQHEAPYQTLDKILGKSRELAIQEKYVPVKVATAQEQFKRLKTKFPDAEVLGALDEGKESTVQFSVALPSRRYNKATVKVAFDVPVGFPFAKPDNAFFEEDLRFSYGGWLNKTDRYTHPRLGHCLITFGHLADWSPQRDSLFTYAKVIEQALKTRFGANYDD